MWTLIKAGMFLFPFLKELFLGKEYNRDGIPVKNKIPTTKFAWLKKLLIVMSIVSFMSNVMLVKKTYDMAYRLLQANKEIARLQGLYRDRRGPELQKTKLADTEPKVPVPPAPVQDDVHNKPALPRRGIIVDKKPPPYIEQTTDEDVHSRATALQIIERLKQIDKIQ